MSTVQYGPNGVVHEFRAGRFRNGVWCFAQSGALLKLQRVLEGRIMRPNKLFKSRRAKTHARDGRR